MLTEKAEENPCQAIEELSNTHDQPWLTIQKDLQKIGKVSIAERVSGI